MKFLLSFFLIALSPLALGIELQDQRKILLEIEGKLQNLLKKTQNSSNGAKKSHNLLNKFHQNLLHSASVNPTKGKWQGNFVKSLNVRKATERQWGQTKKFIYQVVGASEFIKYEKQVEAYLRLRRDGLYAKSESFLQSDQYQQAFKNLTKSMRSETAQGPSLSAATLGVFRKQMDEQLNLLSPIIISKPLMSLSSRIPPKAKVPKVSSNTNRKLDSKEGRFGLGFFSLVALLCCYLVYSILKRAGHLDRFFNSEEEGEQNVNSEGPKVEGHSYCFKTDCIDRLKAVEFQNKMFACLEPISSNSDDYESARNIVINRLNVIVTELSKCDSEDDGEARACLISHFKTLQTFVKAMKDGSNSSLVNDCIIQAFRVILEELIAQGRALNEPKAA